MSSAPTKSARRSVYVRDGGACRYCGKWLNYDQFTLDHVLPRIKGGTHEQYNLVVCCMECNQKKRCLTLEEAQMELRPFPSLKQQREARRHMYNWYSRKHPAQQPRSVRKSCSQTVPE